MEIVLTYLTPYLIPLLALLIPIVAIVGSLITKSRREQMMHETLRLFAERGQAIPPELLSGSFGAELKERQNAGINRNAMLYLGGINVGAGLGLVVMFMAMDPRGWLWAIGCLPLFVGVAMLLAWKYEQKLPAA
jgi:hypothetical protein